MVKNENELKQLAAHYVEELQKRGVRVERVILFGSYGRGTASERSDIDLAFISRDFERFDLFDRQTLLASCRPGFVRTDVIAYSPRLLEERKSSDLVKNILTDGRVIFQQAA